MSERQIEVTQCILERIIYFIELTIPFEDAIEEFL